MAEKPIPSGKWTGKAFRPFGEASSEPEPVRRDEAGTILDAVGGGERWEVVPAEVTLSEQERQLWERAFSGGLPDLSIDDRRDLAPDPRRYRGRRRPPVSPITPRTP